MEALAVKLGRVIESALSSGRAELETLGNGHVCGHVISSEFKDLDYEARRDRLRQVIEQARANQQLSEAEILRISTLLTYTPEEWSVSLEEA